MVVTKISCAWRLFAITAVAFAVAFGLVPYASADITGVANVSGRAMSTGSGGAIPYSLADLENGTESLLVGGAQGFSPVNGADHHTGSTSSPAALPNGGTAKPKPGPTAVPDSSSTLALLAIGLSGLGFVGFLQKRRLSEVGANKIRARASKIDQRSSIR